MTELRTAVKQVQGHLQTTLLRFVKAINEIIIRYETYREIDKDYRLDRIETV